ncbi:MAG TPA: hypothetical protein PKD85_05580, partial [Saprospiraceae bacterium]|nr:hypothetical protein [Saprospiraceae bacterium]
MKKLVFLIIISLLFTNCSREVPEIMEIKKISTYWHFGFSEDNDRGLLFAFYDDIKRPNKLDLKFKWHITGQNILIELVDFEDKGLCPIFPSPFPNLEKNCTSDGSIFIPEDMIPTGSYKFNIKAESVNISLDFNFDGIKYSFIIPNETQFSITKKEIYPMPKNILFGSVVYEGEESTAAAQGFKNDLNNLGFMDIIVPNFDKIPVIYVDSVGNPV